MGEGITKWILKKQGVKSWAGFVWLKIGASSGLLRTLYLIFEFPKGPVIS
jgi:hypothetical protein